ncbi:hypothetical protein FVB32_10355 [Flagellimonas hymeniacidonis]|uniref:Uncharacterized protein n=1 Tax=Flagellimonas hymeniacidonis TaxID=2603628 RepID=A0A5C8V057_9FLAO|nr:hypothetical protein [Flagellimonas hymeniacidonis]TXN34990.1 hypothetical protein FVB32_10355 [Flagellimonas hymeniacidonis]
MSKKIEKPNLTIQKGDIMLSPEMLPWADAIVTTSAKNQLFDSTLLKRYLDFLELVVLNNRLLISYKPKTDLSARVDDELIPPPLYSFKVKGDLNLDENMTNFLDKQGILLSGRLPACKYKDDLEVIEKYLPYNKDLKQYYSKAQEVVFRQYSKIRDKEVVHQLTLIQMGEDIGNTLYLNEAFKQFELPYILAEENTYLIETIEENERKTQTGVINYLKKSLNDGALKEVERLATIGGSTVFPYTPIASEIVMNSNNPEDFLKVAMELRTSYKKFREEMVEIEKMLFDSELSLKKKLKLVKTIEGLANELWSNHTNGFRKSTIEISGLSDILEPMTYASSAGLVKKILEYPTDLILSHLRKRKVRVMLNSKKNFLSSKDLTQKLTTIFHLPKQDIIDGLTK